MSLAEVLARLNEVIVSEAVSRYVAGERPEGFNENPNRYAIESEHGLLPLRPIVAIAARYAFNQTITGRDMASGKTTLCRRRFEQLGFKFVKVR